MNKKVLLASLAVVLVVVLLLSITKEQPSESSLPVDIKSLTYTIDGYDFALDNGLATRSLAPESSFLETVRVFGEPVYADLDGDGDEDGAIWLEHQPGGSGTFYYAALALKEGDTYVPTNVMLLGDRIAPQTLNIEEGRAVYNFAERRADEPFTTRPSWGRSVYVQFDKNSGQIGEWVKDFEGEGNYTERYSRQVDRVSVAFEHYNYTTFRLITGDRIQNGELNTERGYKDDIDATVFVLNWQDEESEQLRYVKLSKEPDRIYLLDTNGEILRGSYLLIH